MKKRAIAVFLFIAVAFMFFGCSKKGNSEVSKQLTELEALVTRLEAAVKENDGVKAMGIATELAVVGEKLESLESQMSSAEKSNYEKLTKKVESLLAAFN